MKLYIDRSHLTETTIKEILTYFFISCNKINIYFPNESNNSLSEFKTKFLNATSILPAEEENSPLEPKEGFTMVIASLPKEVQSILAEYVPNSMLNFGLIKDDQVILYFGEDGEIVIETDDETICNNSLFSSFKQI